MKSFRKKIKFLLFFVAIFIIFFSLWKGFMSSYNDLYLEKIKGRKALLWVKKQNKRSLNALKSHPHFKELKSYKKRLLESEDKLIYASLQGDGLVYNFWKDKKYKRGLLRRTNLKNYLSGKDLWEEVLNLDALAEKEKENWVYKKAKFHPKGKKVLLYFSRGGKDASVIREFDLVKKDFVKDGFYLPEARSVTDWLSEDEIAVRTDWKTKDSLTNSKLPRIVKTIRRGDSITQAVTVFKVEKTDVSVGLFTLQAKNKDIRLIIVRSKDFFSSEFFLRKKNGELAKMPLPLHTYIETSFQENLIFNLKKSWTWKKQHYKAGSFLIVNPDKLVEGKPSAVQLLMEPNSERFLYYAGASKNSIYIKTLKDVKSSIIELKPEGKFWKEKHLPLPAFSTSDIIYSNPREAEVFFTSQGFLENPKLYHYNDVSGHLTKIQELSPRFNPSSYKVEQFFAKSFDGTNIPYFVVRKKSMKHDGKNPVLLYAYGGFNLSRQPYYNPMQEFSWYRKGGVFVMANI